MTSRSITRRAGVLAPAALLLVLAAGCAPDPGPTVGTESSGPAGGDKVDQAALPGCGDRIAAAAGELAMAGDFPSRVGAGDGTFAGSVTVTSTGARVTGVTSPEADVYVAREGEVVATALAKDLIGRPVDLGPGAGLRLAARGSLRQCAAPGGLLPAGRYQVFAVVVVSRDDQPAVAAVGGPWPLELT